MSWSIDPTTIELGLGLPYLQAALRETPERPQEGYGEDESKAAINTAKRAIVNVIDEGVFDTTGKVEVYASGHSNPGGVPEPGWSTDSMHIYVYKLPLPEEEA